MSIWFGPKGKTYTGTGENSWLKRYVEHLTGQTKAELAASIESAVTNEATERSLSEEAILSEVHSITNNTTLIKNADGGFAAGEGATIHEDVDGEKGQGGAIGKGAKTSFGFAGGFGANASNGGSVGCRASATDGGAVGDQATASIGGAVGNYAEAGVGGAVGAHAKAAYGGAVGHRAQAESGGAIGREAKTFNGFAGGNQAITAEVDSNGHVKENGAGYAITIDAIQLGKGINSTPKTLQVYNYQLMDKDGNIPVERLKNASGAKANADGGFATGLGASATSGGAIGWGASATAGGAIGRDAYASRGGAVGREAKTAEGFAGGYLAQTVQNNTPINAIQLGTGTNPNFGTLQVYCYQLMDANGMIPNARRSFIITKVQNNTLLLQENQDARLGELSSLVLSMPQSISDWYRSTFSFQSGESATSLVYDDLTLNWTGDDVTEDGEFVPASFATYEVEVKNLGINGIRAKVDKIKG